MPPSIKPEFVLRIGVDMGGVCIHKSEKYESNSADFDGSLNMKGCVKALTALKDAGHYIVLVSYCGAHRAHKTQLMLNEEYPNLFDEIMFVKKRYYKKIICKAMALDILIDDRLDILRTLDSTIPVHFIADVLDKNRSNGDIIEVNSWAIFMEIVNDFIPIGGTIEKPDMSRCHVTL
jgi:hypothetical protein